MFPIAVTLNKYDEIILRVVRMSKIVRIVVAIVCGIIGTYLMIGMRGEEIATEYMDVVVAAKDLKEGTMLDRTMIESKSIPANYCAPDAVLWKERQGLTGRRLMVPVMMPKGAQVSRMHLPAEQNKGFCYQIPQELRALSINVSRSTGVSGLLRPGSHVDIIGIYAKTIESGTITPTTVIQVLLQDVTVLAAGRSTSTLASDLAGSRTGGTVSYSTITVAVKLNEAQILIAASARGKLYCVLRNPGTDSRPQNIPVRTLNDALSGAAISENNADRFGSLIRE